MEACGLSLAWAADEEAGRSGSGGAEGTGAASCEPNRGDDSLMPVVSCPASPSLEAASAGAVDLSLEVKSSRQIGHDVDVYVPCFAACIEPSVKGDVCTVS